MLKEVFNNALLVGRELPAEVQVMLKASVNGVAMFMLSYIAVYLCAQTASALVASFVFGISTELNFNGLEFHLNGKVWTPTSVATVFMASPITALVLALLCLIVLRYIKAQRTIWKQFLLWGFLHGLILSIGTFISGAAMQDGTWLALRWLSLPNIAIVGFAAASGLIMLGIGLLSAPLIFMCCDSHTLIKAQNRGYLLSSLLWLPWVAGAGVLILLKHSASYYDIVLLGAVTLLLLIPLHYSGKDMLVNSNINSPRRTIVNWSVVGLAGTVGLFCAFVL